MSDLLSSDDVENAQPKPAAGKVNKVCQRWLVHEDGVLAHQMQEQEFSHKYQWNKSERKQARIDVPLTKFVQTEEEERMQKERMLFLEKQRELANKDAAIAQDLYEKEKQNKELLRQRAQQDAALAEQYQERQAQESVAIQRQRAERDAAMAQQLYEREMQKKQLLQQRAQQEAAIAEQYHHRRPPQSVAVHRLRSDEDANVAQKYYQVEVQKSSSEQKQREDEDSIIAQQFQTEELLQAEQERVRRELRDQDYARQLQDKEKKRYDRRIRGHELARERRRIETEQAVDSEELLPPGEGRGSAERAQGRRPGPRSPTADEQHGDSMERGVANMRVNEPTHRVLREDGRLEDAGDFSDFYITPSRDMTLDEMKELQELQDQELARLLQDQERRRGSEINRSKLKEIEARDEELARIMHEQEKLKAKRRHHHQRHHNGSAQRNPSSGSTSSIGRGGGGGADRQLSNERSPTIYDGPPVPVKQVQLHEEMLKNEAENILNDVVHEQTSPTSRPSYPDRLPEHYQARPLPEPPQERNFNNNGTRSSNGGSPPTSPPPGYRPPPDYPRGDAGRVPESALDPAQTSPNNLFAVIDPTYRDDDDDDDDDPLERPFEQAPEPLPRQPPQQQQQQQRSASQEDPQYVNSAPRDRNKSTDHQGREEQYADLDEFGPVAGQRRTNLQRSKGGKKGGSCKQQ